MLQPETYIILGANSAIGSELAKSIAPKVQQLILFYHQRKERIVDLVAPNIWQYPVDITNFNDFMGIIHQLKQEFKAQDLGAVYLPTIRSFDHQPLLNTDLKLTREIIDVNFLGAIHFLKSILSLDTVNSQRIVLLGSNVSKIGLPNGSVYAATKAAIANLTKSVAQEVGYRNILINTVSPGPVITADQSFDQEYQEFRENYFATQKKFTCLNRLAEIDDVCALIKFLTSLENKHITGEEIFITGGVRSTPHVI